MCSSTGRLPGHPFTWMLFLRICLFLLNVYDVYLYACNQPCALSKASGPLGLKLKGDGGPPCGCPEGNLGPL